MNKQNNSNAASGKPALGKAGRANMIVTVAAVCVVAAVVGGFWLRAKLNEPPRFNAPIQKLAQFVGSPALNKLPFERQAIYIQQLSSRSDDLDAAWETGKLSDQAYKRSLEMTWFASHLKNMELYYQFPTQEERTKMLDRLLDERERDRERKKKKKADGTVVDADSETRSGKPKIKRDEMQEVLIPQAWPEEDRIRWIQYREALRQRDNDREKAKKAVEKAEKAAAKAAGATQPSQP